MQTPSSIVIRDLPDNESQRFVIAGTKEELINALSDDIADLSYVQDFFMSFRRFATSEVDIVVQYERDLMHDRRCSMR